MKTSHFTLALLLCTYIAAAQPTRFTPPKQHPQPKNHHRAPAVQLNKLSSTEGLKDTMSLYYDNYVYSSGNYEFLDEPELSSKTVYSYDSLGLTDVVYSYYYYTDSAGQHTYTNKRIYYHDYAIEKDTLIEYYYETDTGFVLSRIRKSTYSDTVETTIDYTYIDSTKEFTQSYFYKTYLNRYGLDSIYFSYKSDSTINYKYTSIYNSDSLLTEHMTHYYTDGDKYKREYSYNEKKQIIQRNYFYEYQGSWINTYDTRYTYDDNGLKTGELEYYVYDGAWDLRWITAWVYSMENGMFRSDEYSFSDEEKYVFWIRSTYKLLPAGHSYCLGGIAGRATDADGEPLQMGKSLARLYDAGSPSTEPMAESYISRGGEFSILPQQAGSYYLQVVPTDEDAYLNLAGGYPGDAAQWAGATLIELGCGDTLSHNLQLEKASTGAGHLDLKGKVSIQDYTSAKNLAMSDESTADNELPNVSVILISTADNKLSAYTLTDFFGSYALKDVGPGDYRIAVDIPGYTQKTTYAITIDNSFNITANGQEASYFRFGVDTAQNVVFAETTELATGCEQARIQKTAVYPNPAQDMLYVEIPREQLPATYTITAMGGTLAQSGILESHELNLSGLKPGSYVLYIRSGEKRYYATFMKVN